MLSITLKTAAMETSRFKSAFFVKLNIELTVEIFISSGRPTSFIYSRKEYVDHVKFKKTGVFKEPV